MSNTKSVPDLIRNAATAEVFATLSSDAKSKSVIDSIRSFSDAQLDFMGKIAGVPEHHRGTHRAMMRDEDNEFMQKIGALEHRLETGDIILVAGVSNSSKILVKSQKTVYPKARSSHVAVAHADFVCVDAIPSKGVSNRLVPDVFSGIENNWRVIRCSSVTDDIRAEMLLKCAYYLQQPYRIFPKRKPAKKYSYCSELARKIYIDVGVNDSRIPKNIIIKPCDFDRLADKGDIWDDVTEQVAPFVAFCHEYREMIEISSKLFVNGLELNRQRDKQRSVLLEQIAKQKNLGNISDAVASELTGAIRETDEKMNFAFWDTATRQRQ